MESLVLLIIYLIIFCIAAYGLYWVCTQFGLPKPVLWLCGAVLLLIILLWLVRWGGGAPSLHFP